ncbi:MAG: hypothetical protein IPL46_14885 [Saprospiraceae bacterium]|nr:hypothetical protein [Saprospiraceae bacterium]
MKSVVATIMSYSGTCDASQNVPGSGIADQYFHAFSLDQAINFINGQTCEMATATGNTPPVVNANPCGGTHTIPKGTPFRLTGSGTDANGDLIFYTWEQFDEDGVGVPTQGLLGAAAGANAAAPLFRSYPPSTNPTRVFPNQNLIAANNYASSFEPLPSVARTLNFRLTGRDWKAGGGGVNSSDLAITVSNSGPLAVTSPNGGEMLTSGNMVNVTWNNGGSNAFCNLVNIRLSIDGGLNFPYTLSTGTPNDGTESVTIPAGVINTTTAKVMVESACNDCVVFFDISNANFSITSDCLAGISDVCPATPLNLPVGAGGLNMGLTKFFGGGVTQFNYVLNGASPSGNMINSTVQNGLVCNVAGNWRHSVSTFTVSATGKYNFSLDPNGAGFRMFSIYLGAYNSANPCPNFLGSNSWANWSAQGGKTVDLTACTSYSLVTWTLNEDNTGNILVNGEGTVYSTGGDPGLAMLTLCCGQYCQ